MSEDPVILESGLLLLPAEVLQVIGEFLNPQDLLALSAVCRYLRSVFNINSLWRKYTHGGNVSLGLSSTVSLVKPSYQDPCITSLEPLCEHRIHFLKQSRLLNNFRQGIFVEHSTDFSGYLSEFETLKPLNNRQITQGSKYLFTVDYEGDDEVIRIFDIELFPKLLLTVNLENHPGGYSVITWVQVVKDKLVVRRDDWFDIYAIQMPDSVQIVYSIHVDGLGSQWINETVIIGKLLFIENSSSNVINIWDLDNGSSCSDLNPKIIGPDFKILGYSQDENLMVLSVGMFVKEPSEPHIFVYDTKLQDFSPFLPILNKDDFKSLECYGLINVEYVVLLNERSNLNYSVFVFNYNNSLCIAQKTNLLTRRIEDAKIIDGYLLLPSLVSVLVMDLKSLQTVWELQLVSADSLVYEFPLISMIGMEVLHISSLSNMIVIYTASGIEMWDFHTRKKILDFPVKGLVALNDTFSKLVIADLNKMIVLSYW